MRGLILVAACVWALASACASSTDAPEPNGGSAPRPTDSPVPTVTPVILPEDDFARAMLITVEELGAGWEDRAPEGLTDPLEPCFGTPVEGKRGEAVTSPPFLRGETQSLSETVAVFETPEQAEAEIDGIDERIGCTVTFFNQGKADDPVLTFSGALASPLNVPVEGDSRIAYRLQVNIDAAGRTGPESRVTLFVDFVAVQQGRVVYTLAASAANRPFDSVETASFVGLASGKIRQQ